MIAARMSTMLDYERKTSPPHAAARVGVACGLGAYLFWGFVPLYFKLVGHVAPIQILAHRVIWSLLFVGILTPFTERREAVAAVLKNRRKLLLLTLSTIVLSLNWYTFIYAVEHNMIMEASLGYFINPLVSVLLGIVFLGERLRSWQGIGLVLAAAGVACMTWSRGQVPMIALILAVSFGFYGLMRKIAHVGAVLGLTIETALLLIPALLIVGPLQSAEHAPYDLKTKFFLGLAGLVTAIPLLLFTAATHRLRLATMGFLQYIGPTVQFLLAVFAFHEPLNSMDLASFALIWSALAIYSWDSYLAYRRGQMIAPSLAAET
jgi:chloramphenicol-sensitive protein RarD